MKPKFVTALDAGILGRVVASARGCYSLLYPLTPECGRGGANAGTLCVCLCVCGVAQGISDSC